MPKKKNEPTPAAEARQEISAASKSQHDALRKRVDALEAQVAGLAQRINVDLSEFEES